MLAISIAPLKVHYYSEPHPTTTRVLCRNFTLKRTGNSKGLAQGPYVAARALRESNPRPSVWKLSTQPMRHHIFINSTNTIPTTTTMGVFSRCI